MRIGRAIVDGRLAIVACIEERWYDITAPLARLTPPARSILHLLESGRFNSSTLSAAMQSAAPIEAPTRFELPHYPSKVVCLGRNYAEHARELGNEIPDEPVLFNKTPNTYGADGSAIRFDPAIGRVDHEGEIALVIGPATVVAGYTLLNDVTARDLQAADKAKGLPWFRSKNLNTFCPIGPVIRLSDSLPPAAELDIEVRVNGQLRQRGNTRQFLVGVPAMLRYISRFMSLIPGDLVATGTPAGVGPLTHGGEVAVSCPEIGILRSFVVSEHSRNT